MVCLTLSSSTKSFTEIKQPCKKRWMVVRCGKKMVVVLHLPKKCWHAFVFLPEVILFFQKFSNDQLWKFYDLKMLRFWDFQMFKNFRTNFNIQIKRIKLASCHFYPWNKNRYSIHGTNWGATIFMILTQITKFSVTYLDLLIYL